jgi:hypothetical protein
MMDDVVAKHSCVAARRAQQAEEHANGGCLARSIGTQETKNLAALNIECHLIDRRKTAEATG